MCQLSSLLVMYFSHLTVLYHCLSLLSAIWPMQYAFLPHYLILLTKQMFKHCKWASVTTKCSSRKNKCTYIIIFYEHGCDNMSHLEVSEIHTSSSVKVYGLFILGLSLLTTYSLWRFLNPPTICSKLLLEKVVTFSLSTYNPCNLNMNYTQLV